MDEDTLNLQIRKFLKKVGISSQREIEKAVRAAAAAGQLDDGSPIEAIMTLRVPALDLELSIEDEIALR